jgi:hypothetical protein
MLPGNKTYPIQTLDFQSLTMKFLQNSVSMMGTTAFKFVNPLGQRAYIALQTASINVTMYDDRQRAFGHLQVSDLVISNKHDMDLGNSGMMTITDESTFGDFIYRFFRTNGPVYMNIMGTIDTAAKLSFGAVHLNGVGLNVKTSLMGLNGLNGSPIRVYNVNILKGSPNFLLLQADLDIYNPSSVAAALGEVAIDVYFMNYKLGSANLPADFTLKPGKNTATVQVQYLNPPQVGRIFMSDYIQGKTSILDARGNPSNSKIPSYLSKAVASLSANSTLQGLQKPLINKANLIFDLIKILAKKIPTTLDVMNPFNVEYQLYTLNFKMRHKNVEFAQIEMDLSNNPIRVPANSKTFTTQELQVKVLKVDLSVIKSLIGNIYVDVYGSMTVGIDQGFKQQADYTQMNVPASFANKQTN